MSSQTFTSNGSFTVPSGVTNVSVLVVAGGGGGGSDIGGGGGGGGVVYDALFPTTPGSSIAVQVGTGGLGATGAPPAAAGANGGNSSFGTLVATGGGGGGGQYIAGSSGGSGGGGAGGVDVPHATAGGSGTSGQGYTGGNGSGNRCGGGGGGAAAAGSTAISTGGNGGSGYTFNSSVYGSGGGGGSIGTPGSGGTNAGNGGTISVAGTNATANYGGGGGGGGDSNASGGNGGSGIVIVSWPSSFVTGPGSSTANDVALFADSTGTVLKDGGALATVATSGAYSDLTGTPGSLPPNGSAGGDLSGSYPNPNVAAIHETSGPTKLAFGSIPTGDFLMRSGTSVIGAALAAVATSGAYSDLSGTPSALPPNGTAGGDLSGSYPNPNVAAIHETSGPTKLAFGSIPTGDFLMRSGTSVIGTALATVATTGAYSDLSGTPTALPPDGTASGDLAGTYPSPQVAALHETSGPTQLTIGAVPNGDFLMRSGTSVIGTALATVATTGAYSNLSGAPTALPPDGTASGDLAGTYPSPQVAALHETSGPTQLTIGAVPDGDFLMRSGSTIVGATPTSYPDGWTPSALTWTYSSASAFTISGDQSANFAVGDRVKLTQTSVSYFYVVGVSYSGGTTTITITGGNNYTLANAAITLPFSSKLITPNGFPQWFTWTPTVVGYSTAPASADYTFNIIGRQCTLAIRQDGTGSVSNSTALSFSLPVTAASRSAQFWVGPGVIYDAGTAGTSPGMLLIQAGGTVVNAYKNFASGAWTASGVKVVSPGNIVYEI